MSSKTKRLGNLADIYQSESLDGNISQIQLSRIHPSEEQPRIDRTTGVDDLAVSLKKEGLLSPLIVTKEGERYRIIAGERRYHAASKLGWEQIECRIISREGKDYWRIAIIENIQRENLNAEEEASALARLKKQEQLSDSQLAKLVGKSRNYITEILGIAQLPEELMSQCRELGIRQRNMLIQAVQSYKKGRIEDFLKNYRSGAVRTVHKAREFNQGKSQDPKQLQPSKSPKSLDDLDSTDKKDAADLSADFKLKLEKNMIIIECPGASEAQKFFAKIRLQLPKAK